MDAANENLNVVNMKKQMQESNSEPAKNSVQDEIHVVEENSAVQPDAYTGQEKLMQTGEIDNLPETAGTGLQENTNENAQEALQEAVGENGNAQVKKIKKVRTHASLAKNIVSVVFFTLSLVLGISATTVLLVRQSLTPQSIEKTVKNMTIGDIGIGFWFGQQGQDITLDEYMTDVFNSSGVVSVQQKDVKKLLDSEFVKSFVSDRFNRYISDFMYGTGEGCISIQDIKGLLDENWDEISVKLGIDAVKVKGKTQDDIKKVVLDGAYDRLAQDIHFGSFTLSNFRKEYPVALNVASSVITYPAILSMAAVAVLLWFIILFMNIRYCGGFRYIGRCMSLIGIVNLAAAGAMYVLPVTLDALFGLGYDFYISFMTLQVMHALYIGAGFLGCGIIITLVGKMLRAARKRILRRKLT